ncbi:alpha/beta hydrolase [Spongiibacter sp. KMU-158]|uniref:Alpha/beta hydrolase n=1 Tax=Spongiibacter pelagi TaxID=2760804 RepID=A0A927GVQ1_9GAMM|nr:alpha/beta hydrolase [Spongiibacter pelagi]MBD2858122.1 alpha/beta hydrolase [Spongiibacter pelagi]
MISPPKSRHTFAELPRGAVECLQLALSQPLLKLCPAGDGHPVVVIPGYGGAEGSTRFLRKWLNSKNYDCHDWQQGRNLPKQRFNSVEQAKDFRREKVDSLKTQLDRLYQHSGKKASLVGWSLGGIYAHDLASEAPELVRGVITLGTPFGDPRGTAVWSIMSLLTRQRRFDTEQEIENWGIFPEAKVPTTVIHSDNDGFVSPSIAKLNGGLVKHVQVNSSHIGFTANPRVFWQIGKSLAAPEVGSQNKRLG